MRPHNCRISLMQLSLYLPISSDHCRTKVQEMVMIKYCFAIFQPSSDYDQNTRVRIRLHFAITAIFF